MNLVIYPQAMARIARLFQDESARSGRKRGQHLGVRRQLWLQNKEAGLSPGPERNRQASLR
jgi:hypothetical protein